ncbi:MAG: E3 ubiquitin ligase family protein [Acidobacteriota bacterium]
MWIFGLLLLAAAGGLAYGHRSKLKRLGRLTSTDVHTAAHLRELASSMADGLGAGSLRFPAAVSGTARCDAPLTSELTQTPSVYYDMRVRREFEEERERDGQRETVTRSESVAHNRRALDFQLEDATGAIPVDPDGASFVAEKVLSRFEREAIAGDLQIGAFTLRVRASGSGRTLGYRFEEEAIPVGTEVLVVGEATDEGGELRLAAPADGDKLLVSVKGKPQLIRELASGAKGLKIGAVVCGALGLLLLIL